MTTRKQPGPKTRQPARTPAASSEPTTTAGGAPARASAAPAPVEQAAAIPVARETHASAVQKPGLVPRGAA